MDDDDSLIGVRLRHRDIMHYTHELQAQKHGRKTMHHENENTITCPQCGHDDFTVAILYHHPRMVLSRNEEGTISVDEGGGEFCGDSEVQGEKPYCCGGCGRRFSGEQLLGGEIPETA